MPGLTYRTITAIAMLTWAHQLLAAADFNGIWKVTEYQEQLRTTEGREPPLLPAAAARYAANLAAFRKGDTSFDLTAHQCSSPGTPRVLFLPYPFEIMQTAEQITFIFEWNHLFRAAPVGKAPEVLYATAIGASKASWQGDVLVIETDNLSDRTLLDAAGLPHSESLKITERYQLSKDGRRLDLRIRFEDSQTFSAPWETHLQFQRLTDFKFSEDICLDRKARGEPPFSKRVSPEPPR